MQNTLVIGYGNVDREDDGLGWHVLQKLAAHFDSPVAMLDGGTFDQSHNPQLVFVLQLTPEMAESFAEYERVCFVDAHTGTYEEEVRVVPVRPGYQTSPFTHHLTPESCLHLAQTLYGHAPEGLMVSVRGYQFGYRAKLSPQTASLAEIAANRIIDWVNASKKGQMSRP
jgi:hydrogenase maturation protease